MRGKSRHSQKKAKRTGCQQMYPIRMANTSPNRKDMIKNLDRLGEMNTVNKSI